MENGRSASRNKANHNHHHRKRHRHRHRHHHEPRSSSYSGHWGVEEMYDFQSSNPELPHQDQIPTQASQKPVRPQHLPHEKFTDESGEPKDDLKRQPTYSSMSQETIPEDLDSSGNQSVKPDIHLAVATMIKAWKTLEALDEI